MLSCRECGLHASAAKSIVDVIIGPNAWGYFGELRARFDAKGMKGRTTKPATIDVRMRIKHSKDRKMVAGLLVMYRDGASTEEMGASVGLSGGRVSYILNKYVKRYRAASRRRRQDSKLQNKMRLSGRLSRAWPKESEFRDHVAELIASSGYNVRCEVKRQNGEHGRTDILVESGARRMVIECKVVAKPSKMDQALGQAYVSGVALAAMPCACVPSDIWVDSLIARAAGQMGVALATEATVMAEVDLYFCQGTSGG